MKHFSLTQCALALCLGLASFLPGQSVATNAPDASSPIGITLAAQEESGYAFESGNPHVEYMQINNGRGKQMRLKLPSSSPMVYIKASLTDVNQANAIIFHTNWKDRPFENGAIWIEPSDCRLEGTTQIIPFGARAKAVEGSYSYTVAAYTSKDASEPVATWEATYHVLENMPSISLPKQIHNNNSFDVHVKQGTFKDSSYVKVYLGIRIGDDSSNISSFTATGLSLEEGRENSWISPTQPLVDRSIACQFQTEGEGIYYCSVDLYDTDGNQIIGSSCDIVSPFEPAATDLAVLKKLATLNPDCTELVNYVHNEAWKANESYEDPDVRVDWESAHPSHITALKIERQEETLNLSDIADLEYLESLQICYNKEITAPLNLSKMSKLDYIYMWNEANLTFKDIIFPKDFAKKNITATSKIWQIGAPRDDRSVEVPNNTTIDLAAYVGDPIKGSTTTYKWQKNWQDTQLTPIKEGTYKLHGEVGDCFYCEIKNDSFPNWTIQTPQIYLTQGEIIFDEAEIAGIKKLASDNPQNEEFKEFVEQELWKAETWDKWDMKYPLQLKWTVDEENNGRLTGLRIRLQSSSSEKRPTKLDLTPFPELIEFETSDGARVESVDFSKNTKLQRLGFYNSDEITSLDLSACTSLKDLGLHLNNMTELKWKATSNLERLYLIADIPSLDLSDAINLKSITLSLYKLSSLDISMLNNLEEFQLDNSPELKSITGLESRVLTSLKLANTGSMYKEAVEKMDFSKLTKLDYSGSSYDLPNTNILKQLESLGLPVQVTEFDMNQTPKLTSFNVGWNSSFRYSGIQNYKQKSWYDENSYHPGVDYNGHTRFDLPGSEKVEGEWATWIYVGDTIDLSSEAVINDKPSTFIWINSQYYTEEKELFVPTDKPGVFIVNPEAPLNDYGQYRLKIWNESFASNVTINSSSGWIMETNTFKVLKEQTEPVFETKDVEALATIVNNSKNQALINWFNNEGWKKNGYTYLGDDFGGVQVQWSNEPTKRLTYLSLGSMYELLTGTVDVSALDRLERLELPLTHVSAVKLPTNPKQLKGLNLSNTKVTTLDLTACTNLLYLNAQNSDLERCDLSKNTQLEHLQLGGTKVALDTTIVYPEITYFMTPESMTSFNMNQMPKLTSFHVDSKTLKFSDIQNPRQMKNETSEGELLNSYSYLTASDIVYKDVSMVAKEAVLDFSKEIATGATISDLDSLITTDISGQYKVDWEKAKLICIDLTNEKFPGWTLHYPMSMLTDKGDVNYDEQVNVQDVTATAARLAEVPENMLWDYSIYAGDVNENEEIDAGDLVGIVNIIMDKPFTKSSELRAAYQPTVDVQMDEKNFLTMENEVPVAALYLEIVGANAETALLADAARLMQASSLKGDTLRIVAYSLDGRTIASGKHILAQLQPGMRVVKATFSDAQAALLQTTGDLLSTANETIVPEVEAKAIYNYPNPAAGQTTFCYQLAQPARSVEIQFFASNGAFVARLQGLPTEAGSQSYSTTLPLGAGVYYYRLVIDGKQVTATNTLIIK